jgi:DNA polymerase-1
MDSSELSAEQLEYIKNDVKYLRSIYEKQIKDAEEKKLTKVLNLEMDLIPVITTMEYFGIKIDTESWRLIFPKLEEEKKQLELEIKTMMFDSISEQISPEDNLLSIAERLCIPVKKKSERNALIQVIDLNYIRDWVIEHINLSSPKQVLSILNQMGINIPNTEESTLIDYEHENLIISKLLKYREIIKLLTTYGENILAKIHPVTGSLHPEFNQVGAATGRFSSSNPNAQNIPATPEFRKNFIARPGYKIITADYNQQEYRLAGATSGDEKIIHAYKQGHDIHTATASIAFDKSLDQVTKEERTNGKKINFLTLYGGSPKKLHKILGFPMDKATDIINKLNSSYSKLNLFRERYGEMAFEKGYSVTLLGRKRWFNKPKIYPSDKEYDIVKSRIKRQGYNTLIQGTGADIVKLAMVSCFYNNPFGLDKFRILLQVHDEIVFEVAEEIVEQAVPFIKTCMEDAEQQFLGEIPAVVEISVDNFWRK